MTAFSTLRSIALTLGLAATMALNFACGGSDDPSTVEGACDRLDECQVLAAAGVSRDECVEIIDTALDNATPSDRNDWESIMDSCLEFESCNAFRTCAAPLF
ncbi:MAG TPA: hypothetical protein VEL05_08815 [Candidatus Acidoferrum sp.]|nr:hypothetical protein [Candidatus Acidoferrum sp.]